MPVLDRYIIRKFISTLLFALLIFTLVSIAIDFSDKVQNFIEKTIPAREILAYYTGFAFHMAGLLIPMYTLISVVFFTSRMAFNAELLSVLNAGVSFQRLMRPYLLAGGAIALMHGAMNHFVIPIFNKGRLHFERTHIWTDLEKVKSSNVHFLLSPGVKAYVQGYNKYNKTISNLRLERFENNRVLSIMEAESAMWIDSTQRWQLSQITTRQFDGLNETYVRNQIPLDTALSLRPEDFIFYHNDSEERTTPELRREIARDRERGLTNKSFEVEVARRSADAFTSVILTIIGLALAGRKVRGGVGFHLALAIGIGALYILLSKFAVSFASSGNLPIVLGMWIPNLAFTVTAVWLVMRAQK